MSSNGPMGRVTLGVLSAGMRVLYWDEDPNGQACLREAVVVRARGLGVLLESVFWSVSGEKSGSRFRVTRSEINKVLP